ncbi:hypothetical protein FACS1894151_08460 [Spirochaetia bacterium]|nr:hypothetical protein FACS1894151_08460 [Spirochaetia bacterium]
MPDNNQQKRYTPEEIFWLIDNQSVSVEDGIKLISNYGNMKAGNEIEVLLGHLNHQLDDLIRKYDRVSAE